MLQEMLQEMKVEAATTRRVLERVPEDKLAWQPHPKSMSLGQLAFHMAMIPSAITGLASVDAFDASQANFVPPQPESKDQILKTLDEGLAEAEKFFAALTPEAAKATWTLSSGGKELIAMPRVFMLRSILLNHWYHHRGQMSVYLRLLEVPVPVIYGRSADENPFA